MRFEPRLVEPFAPEVVTSLSLGADTVEVVASSLEERGFRVDTVPEEEEATGRFVQLNILPTAAATLPHEVREMQLGFKSSNPGEAPRLDFIALLQPVAAAESICEHFKRVFDGEPASQRKCAPGVAAADLGAQWIACAGTTDGAQPVTVVCDSSGDDVRFILFSLAGGR